MRTSHKLSQQGAATIQIMMLVGLMGLVAGAAMLDVDRQLSQTARSGDESMEASSLGKNRGTFNDQLSAAASGISSLTNYATSGAAAENNNALQATPCRKPDGTQAKAGERCGRGFWDSLLNVGSSVYSSVVDGSGESQDSFNDAAVDGAANAANGIWDGITGGADVAWSWLSNEDYREDVAAKLRSGTWEAITHPVDTFDKIVTWGDKTINGIDKAVKDASDVVDSGDAEAIAKQNGSIVGGGVVELAAAALGGAALKGVKAVTKASKVKSGMPSHETPSLSDSVDAPSNAGTGVPSSVVAAVDPRITKAMKQHLKKDGDRMLLPKTIKGEKLNKSGLLELLNHAPDEYGVIRVKSTNELYLVRGNKKQVGFVKGVKGEQRLLYHNHPSNVALPSGRNMEAFAKKKGDIAAIRGLNPKQQSSIIGSRNGTYRHRIPSREEIGSGKLPSVKDDIIGGTGSINTPEMKQHIPMEDARAAQVAAKYAPQEPKPFSLGKMDIKTGRLIPPARLNDISGTEAHTLASGAKGVNPANAPPGDYLSAKAPKQVTPGITTLKGQYNHDGRVEPWEAHYDQHGELKGRTDYNAGNKSKGIADTHHHTYGRNARERDLSETSKGQHPAGPYVSNDNAPVALPISPISRPKRTIAGKAMNDNHVQKQSISK